MSAKGTKFEERLDHLIAKGHALLDAIRFECYPDISKKLFIDKLGQDEADEYVKQLPQFRLEYQAWYSEALVVIKQLLPDRLDDFKSYYEYPGVRKEVSFQNYMIRDCLQGLRITHPASGKVRVDAKAAVPEFRQQLSLVIAAREALQSTLIDLTSILQADLFDSEIDSARALAKSGFLRAAGAICGVIIEKHLKQICNAHMIVIKKKHLTIFDFNQALKDNGVIDTSQWRYVQHLSDIRNVCDHDRGRDPDKEQIDDLLSGTEKVLKTIF